MHPHSTVQAWLHGGPADGAIQQVACQPDGRPPELLMLAEPVSAARAYELGMLTRLVDSDEQVLPEATALAAQLADGPTVAYGQIKRELAGDGLAAALEREAQAQETCGDTADHRDATAAFLSKQRPTFQGR